MLWLCFFNFCPFCGKRMPCQFWVIWCLRCRRWPAKAPIEISIPRHTTCATKVLQSLPWRAFISDPDPTRSEILHHSERPNWTAKMPLTYEAMPASSCKSQAVLLFNISSCATRCLGWHSWNLSIHCESSLMVDPFFRIEIAWHCHNLEQTDMI